MQAVQNVRELQERLAAKRSCKIKLTGSDRLKSAISEAGVASKLEIGVQLVPRDLPRVLLAAICEVGIIAAKASLDGFTLGLKRKENEMFLYFSYRHAGSREEAFPEE